MGTIQQGAYNIVNICLAIKPKEKVVIVTDLETLKISKIIKKEAKKITKNIKIFILENYGKRPLQYFPEEIKTAVKKANVTIIALHKKGDNKISETLTIRRPLRLLALKHGRCANMPSINKKVMKDGMCTNHKKLWKFSSLIYKKLKKAKEIKVTTKLGTNITAKFNKKTKWYNSNGNLRKKSQGGNLPEAEIYSCPANVNGIFIVDGEIGDIFTKKYGLLKTSVKIIIKNSRAIKISSKNKNLEKDIKNYLSTDKNSNKVGEFALGTNIYLKKLIGVFLQDEKFPSMHIAFGNPYDANWSSKIHVDFLILKPTVIVNKEKIMEKGKYLISL